MIQPTHFISCDWGTTNLRIKVVETESLKVVAENNSGSGIRSLNELFQESGENDRMTFFAHYLREQVMKLPQAQHDHPLLVSGMASANIGMLDLPYGVLPIDESGKGFLLRDLMPWPGQRLRLVSGIKSDNGMMRGEETQTLGLLQLMRGAEDGTLLLPGTHSKHLALVNGKITAFSSFMTGELFEIISQRSILANSVAPGAWNEDRAECFRQGVMSGYQGGFSPHLFAIRAGQVLRATDPTDNFYQLSGLLIGDELSHLPGDGSGTIYLAGTGPLLRLYRYALEIAGVSQQLTVYDDQLFSKALLLGQRALLLRDH